MGYHQALEDAGIDHTILGVDIVSQPDYPFNFARADALTFPTAEFDFIHASPPCQAYTHSTPDQSKHPKLIEPIRKRIDKGTYVIENVPGAPLDAVLLLCGSMFGLEVRRHRYFEHNLGLILAPACNHHEWEDDRPWGVYGDPSGFNQGIRGGQDRHKYQTVEHARQLMAMPWVMNQKGLTEAIPPAYTRFIMEQYLQIGDEGALHSQPHRVR